MLKGLLEVSIRMVPDIVVIRIWMQVLEHLQAAQLGISGYLMDN